MNRVNSRRRPRIAAWVVLLALIPGVPELVESAAHLVTEGHWAHAATHSDSHHPAGSEHGCTPIFHLCSCHSGMTFLAPQDPPATCLPVAALASGPRPAPAPAGFGPAVDHPPRA